MSDTYEFVCIHHRNSQTLYVIESHSCVYHCSNIYTNVGIYIAAIENTIYRKLQPPIAPNSHGNGGILIGGGDWLSGGLY